jgi:inhibitor of cysteine peptidase
MILAGVAMLALGGCQWMKPWAKEPESARTPDNPDKSNAGEAVNGVVTATENMNGKAVTLKIGETLFVELESIPTAGYIWEAKSVPAILAVTEGGETTRPTHPEQQNQPGFTGGNHYLGFTYKAVSAGTGKLEMKEGRPWETDEAPIGEWSLKVTVTE